MDDMISRIVELAMSQGLWAVLYLYLFFRMLKENKEREDKYQEMIKELSTNINKGIEQIQKKLDDVLEGKEASKHE